MYRVPTETSERGRKARKFSGWRFPCPRATYMGAGCIWRPVEAPSSKDSRVPDDFGLAKASSAFPATPSFRLVNYCPEIRRRPAWHERARDRKTATSPCSTSSYLLPPTIYRPSLLIIYLLPFEYYSFFLLFFIFTNRDRGNLYIHSRLFVIVQCSLAR